MGVRTTWDDPARTTMRYIIEQPWTMDDLYRAADQMKADIQAGNIPVPIGIILDATRINSLPAGILQSTGPMIRRMQPEARVIVVVSPQRFLKAMYDIFTRLYNAYGDTFQFALTLDDARTLIAERLGSRVSPSDH